MTNGESFYVGVAPFNTHPVWNLLGGRPGDWFSLTLRFRDLNGVYSDSGPFVLSFTPLPPVLIISRATPGLSHFRGQGRGTHERKPLGWPGRNREPSICIPWPAGSDLLPSRIHPIQDCPRRRESGELPSAPCAGGTSRSLWLLPSAAATRPHLEAPGPGA